MAKYEIEVHDDLLDRFLVTLHADRWHSQVQQIALQRRIPEPGPWAVVIASTELNEDPTEWVRYPSGRWFNPMGVKTAWDNLFNPTLVREGV